MIHYRRTWLLLDLHLLIIRNIIFLLLHATNHIKFLLEVLPLLVDALIDDLLILFNLFHSVLFVLKHLNGLWIRLSLIA